MAQTKGKDGKFQSTSSSRSQTREMTDHEAVQAIFQSTSSSRSQTGFSLVSGARASISIH